MVRVTFIEADGSRREIDAEPGQSLMKAAAYGGVAGISADCGGNCACGTCRIYVPAEWRDRLPAPLAAEQEMIDFSQDPDVGVRLSCQIKVTGDLDGLVLTMPEEQHF